ncbi:MAG: hypothetical protein HY735_31375 [Verrucomicrobia bacterium]|nr:hypothetical protein [Verrucomicrobiota bacterium]
MSDNCREILRGALVFAAVLALGLMMAWMVRKLHKPELSVGPLEQVLHGQP